MAKKTITALEITEDYLKLAQAEETSQGVIVTDLALKKIAGKKEGEIGRELSILIHENKIKVQNLIVSIPRQLLTIRTLRFPSVNKEELSSMVKLQAAKQIPYAPEDIITDFKILEVEPSGFSKVLLAIAHKDVVGRYLNILEAAALKARQLVISSEALAAWFSNLKNMPDPAAVLDVDTLNSNLIIAHQGQLVFSRSIAFNAQEQNEISVGNFLEEIKNSFATYQKEKLGPNISKIILTGASNYFLSWVERLKNELALEVEIQEPQKYIQMEEGLEVPSGGKDKSVSLVNIFGLLLIEPELSINLLPLSVRQEQESRVRKKTSLFSIIFLIFIFGALISLILLKIFQKENYLNRLDFELKKISPQAQEIQQMNKRLEFIEDRLNKQGTSIDILYELYKLIPDDISLNIFNLEEKGAVTLQGTSVSMSGVFNLVNILEKSPFLQNVEVKYTSKRVVKNKEITDFQITALVTSSGKKEAKK